MFFTVMGPGLITAFADNDAGGISTYAMTGAHTGLSFVWVMLPLTVSLIFLQDMCARMAMATGKGLSDLIREEFGLKLTFFCMACLLLVNYTTIVAEFAGIASAFEIFGVTRYIAVPLCVFFVWAIVLKGSFRFVEKLFLLLCATSVSYVLCTLIVKPDWTKIASATVYPDFSAIRKESYLFLATIGTTVTPWMMFFLQSTILDKGIDKTQYKYIRTDIIVGTCTADLIAYFIIVCTAVTLFPRHIHINEAADAALALSPLAGEHAKLLFAAGLLGASLLAASILPLSTTYPLCEAFGFESGISKRFEEAKSFFLIYTALVIVGACPVLFPDFPMVGAMVFSQVLSGFFLPVLILFILRLCNNKKLMGEYRNTPADNTIGAVTAAGVFIVSLLLCAKMI